MRMKEQTVSTLFVAVVAAAAIGVLSFLGQHMYIGVQAHRLDLEERKLRVEQQRLLLELESKKICEQEEIAQLKKTLEGERTRLEHRDRWGNRR